MKVRTWRIRSKKIINALASMVFKPAATDFAQLGSDPEVDAYASQTPTPTCAVGYCDLSDWSVVRVCRDKRVSDESSYGIVN